MSIETNNVAGLFAVESKQTARVASRRIGFTLAAAMLAGTSLAPAAAQVFDVNGISVTTADFAALPGGLPIQILNNAVTTGTLRVNATGNLAFGGDLTNGTGVLALTKIGAGTLTLSGNNSFTGNTTVSVGTLQAGSLTALSAASRLNIAVGGTVDLNGFNNSVNGLNGTGTVTNLAGGAPAVLRLANTISSTFGGTITGNVGLLMDSGAGILQTLAQNNSFTGGVELRSGTLRLGADQALSGAAVSVTGNAVLSALAAGASITNAIDVAAGNSLGLTAASGGTLTLGGVISGDGGINKITSGTVRLNAANSFAGVTVLNGGRVEVGNAAAFSTGEVQVAGTTTLALADPALSLAVANNFNNTAALTVAAPNAGSTFTLSGNISTTADLSVDAGAGRVELTGANQFNNANVRVRAGILAVDGADALTGAASVRLANGAALEITTASTIGNKILALGGAGAVVGDIINDVDVTLSGRLHDGAGADTLGLRKLGTGTLTLSNAAVTASTRSQLGGDLAVQAGTVDVTGRLFGDVSVAAGGNLDVTGGVTGNVSVAGTGEIGAVGALIGNVTVNDTGRFTNTGALTGNVTVNALGGFGNTATGTTAGNVTVTAGGTAGGAGTITGNLSFANGVANSFRPFSGPGTVATLNVNGDLTLGDMTTSFFRFDAPGVSTAAPGVSDLVVVGGQLTLGGMLDISDLGGFGTGVYRLFTFGTINAGSPLNVVGTAPAGFTYSFTTAGNGFFLNVDPLAGGTFYWDGADSIGVAGVAGGSGTWNTTTTNWTDITGAANTNWVNSAALSEAFFTATGGTVTLGAGIQFNRLVFEVDGYTIEGNGNSLGTDTGSISVAGGATAIINANIGGVNGLTKLEAGTLRLSGNNGYTGGTNIAAGRVEISSNTALGVDTVTIGDGATLASLGSALTVTNGFDVNGVSTIETGTDLTLSGDIAGTGGITKTGSAQLILSGNNSFFGDVNLNAGTIVARNGTSLGNATTLLAADGTTLAVGVPLAATVMTLGQSISIASRSTLTLDLQGDALSFFVDELTGNPGFDGTDLTLSGTVSGGALTITGGGAVRLQGNNSQSSTFVDRSVVFAESANPFGTGAIRVNEGAIYADGAAPLTLGQNIVVSGLFYVNGPQDLTLTGTLSNLGAGATELGTLVKFGSSSLRIDGDNSINNVRLQDGVLIVGHNNALGIQTLDTANAAGTARTLQAGAADLVVRNQISLVGPLSVDTAGQTLALTGQIFNTGSLVKTGAGTLILSGNNIYSGTTTINAGTVTAGSDAAFSTSVVTMANGTVLSNALGSDMQRTLANNFVLGNVSIDSAGNLFQLDGVLNGAGTVAKIGAGTLRLTGDSSSVVNGFTGTFDVQNGILDLNGRIAGNINVQIGGSLVGTGRANGTVTLNDTSVIAPGNSPGTLTFGNLVLANGTNLNFELAGVAGVPGTDADLIDVTSNLTLDGVLNITPLAGFNVGVGNRTLITYGNLVANNGLTVSNAPPVDVAYSILAGPVASGAGTVRLNVAFTGTYRWDGTDLVPDGVIDGGAGTFNLTNTNFTNSDGTFNLAYGNNATDDIEFGGTAGTVAIASAINFDQMGFVTTGYVLGGAGSLNVNNSAINVNGNTATINTQIAGINGLAKNGTGTLILNGNNSFTGGLAVNAGTVRVGSSTALGAGSVSLAAGTTLQGTAGAFPQIGNAIVLGGAVNFDANGGGTTLNGVISGNGPLSIVDVGPAGTTSGFALGGANSFTGDVSVTNTLLIVTANNGLGNAANALTLNNAIFAQQGSFITARTITLTGTERFLPLPGVTLTANGAIGGAGQLVKDGAGTLVLGNAANSYGGGTVITAGTVSIASDGALGAGGTSVSFSGAPLTGAAPTTLRFTADVTSGRDMAVATGFTGIIDTVANDVRLNGNITGNGAVTKIGAGRLTLTGTNTYAGGTNLIAGTLRIEGGDSIGSGRLTTQAGTTLVAGLAAGAGTITLGNAVTLAGGQTTIDLNGNLLIINPVTGAVSTNGTNLVLNGTITGAGGFTTSNLTAGTMLINGNNDFTGNVNLNSAVVFVGNDNALGTGNTVNINAAAGIRNGVGGTTRTLASAIAINDPNATVGGNGNLVLTGVVSGDANNVFNKVGLGTVTLANAANSIASQIEVAQGELSVTGTLTNANQLTNVRAGATLSGTGTINGIVEVSNAAELSAGVGGNGQVGRLTIGTLLLNEQSSLVFDLGDNYVSGGALNDQIAVTNLRLGGRLTVRQSTGGNFGLGVYNLFTYQGALLAGSTNVQVQTLPGAFTGLVQTLVPGQVNLIVTQPGTFVQYWDGGDATGNGAVNGGTGTWSAAGSNWTGLPDSQLNTGWFNNSVAVFAGTAGTVTLDQMFNAQGLQFVTNGYTLTGGTLDNQSTGVGTGMFVSTDAAVTATINSIIQGDGILFKQGDGTLALGGNNANFSGGTDVQAGTLQLNTALAAGTNRIALQGNTTLANGGGTLSVANAVVTTGDNSIDSGAGSFTLTGLVSGVGSITKTGSGTLTLAGVNSYNGGTTIAQGTLAVTNNLSISTGALTINGGTTLQAAANGLNLANLISLNGLATVDTLANGLTLSGIISDGFVSGTLVKTGSGNLNLTGVNTYGNGTNLNGGSITVFNNASIGTGALAMADTTSLIAGANGLNLANAVSTAGVGTVNTGANTLTLSGVISGAGSVAKTGSGDLTLTNNNLYAGGTALQAGSITVTNSGALGTGRLTMSVDTTLNAGSADLALANAITLLSVGTVNSNGFTLTLNGVIDGDGSLIKTGSGNLVLNRANGYTGRSNVTAGTVTVGNNTAFGTGLVRMGSGTILANNADGLNVGNAFSINGNVEVATGANTFTMSGTVGNPGQLTKTGTGNLILSGNNSYTGGTALTAGTITVTTATALGTGTLTATGGTSLVAGVTGLNVGNTATLLAGNLTVNSGTGTFQLSGPIGGVGGITKINSGNLILSGNSNYSGGTNLNAGSLTVTNNGSIGTGVLTTAAGTTVFAGLTVGGGSAIALTNNVVLNGATTLNLQGTTGDITPQGVLTINGTTLTLNGVVSGAGSLLATGLGRVTLNGNNSYSGGTTLNLAAAYVGSDTAFGTGAVTLDSGAIGNDSGALRTLANSVVLAAAGGGTILGPNDITLTGAISGDGELVKRSTSTLTLNGANSYTGDTTLAGGTIVVGTSTALGTGNLFVESVGQSTTLTAGAADLSLANTVFLQATSNLVANTQAFTFGLNGVISGTGALTKVGSGNLVLNAANNYSGGSSINAGTVTVGNNAALGTALVTMANGTVLANNSNNLNVANGFSIGNVEVATGANTFTMSGTVNGAGVLTKTGSGNLILTGSNGYTGGTALTAGTITFNTNTALGTGTVTTTGGTTLAAGVNDPSGGQVLTLANAFSLGTGATTIDLQGSTLTFGNDSSIVANGTALTLNGVVSGAGSLVVGDFGTLTLNGNNSYAGGTVLNTRSTVYVGSDTALGTGQVTMNGGTFVYNIGGATRTLANSFLLNGGSWLGGTSDTVLTGAITGVGTLIKAGPATLVLNGNNSGFTGQSQLRDGRITVGTSTALGVGGALRVFAPGAPPLGASTTLAAGTTGLALANDVTLDLGSNLIVESGTGSFTLNGVILSAGALTKVQSGTLVLNGANTYAGGTALNVGTIQVGNNTALGNATLAMADGTTLQSGVDALVVANAITTAGVGTIDTQANAFTLNGVISGAGSITKIGSGNLILNAANSYSGGSFINAGTVTVGNNTAFSTSLVTMANGTTLANNADNLVVANAFSIGNVTVATGTNLFTLNGVIGGAGLLTKTGTGTLTLNGDNSYRGGTALTAGTITIGANSALGTGTLTMTGGTSLVAASSLTVANNISTLGVGTIDTISTLTLTGVIDGRGSITKTNRGNLVLQGLNSYSGGTLLDAGTITVATDTALGTGLLTMAGGTTLNTATNVGRLDNVDTVVLGNAITGAGIATFNANDGLSLILNGSVSGIGQFNKTGNGVVALNGDNRFSGGFALNSGTLRTGSNSALGTSTLVTADGTVLQNGAAGVTLGNAIVLGGGLTIDTQTFSYTLNGVISGSGPITKIGSANLTLGGDNSFTGGFNLNEGGLTLTSSGALGTGTFTVADGTSLTAGSNLTLGNAIVLGGAFTLDTAANTVTLNGVVSGSGPLAKQGSGNLVLNAANSYTGGTNLNAGTITLGNSAGLGTGGLTMANGTTLAAGVDGLVVTNGITTLGVGTVNTGAFTLTLNGVIGGAGSIAKNGSGLLILNGANSYAGGTAFNAGTIRVGNSLAFGTGAVTAAAGTTLQTGVSGLTLANAIVMAGGMTVDNFANQMTLGGVLSGTGPLSVIDSTGGNTGVLTLAGENSYTGGTVVTGTTLSVSQNANLGNVAGGLTLVGGTLRTTASFTTARNIVLGAGGGTLAVATGTTLTSNGVISGTSLTKNSGELVLNGASTYTGGTALNAGTITVGNNAALGTGALAMANGTTLNVAPVTGTGVALANNVSLAGVGTINANATLTLTLNGIVSGAGSVTKTGAGVLALNGANSYTGGTALNAGTISVGNNSALGTSTLAMADGTTLAAGVTGLTTANNIVTVGAATINSGATPSAYTVSGVISGAGSVIKQGTGVLTVSAANSYTGATTVAAGTLNVTGSLVSAVTVNSAAALTGTGTVGSLSVLAGGSVNPGAAGTSNIATLNVTGAATLAGTYTANVSTSAADRITAGGVLTLGGTLAVAPTVPAAFNQFNQVFTVASGASRTGTFAASTGLDQFGLAFAPVVEYTATAANIRLAPQSLVTLGNRFGGVTGNALEVAQAFDRAVAAGTNVQTFFNVYANGGNDLPRTLRQMSGEQRATERRVVLDSNRTIREAALDRLNGVVSMGGQQVSKTDGDNSLTFWLRGAGSWGKAQPGEAATAFTTEQRGILTGLDWKSNGLTLGGMFNYTSTNVEYQQLGGSSNVETVGGTLYAGYRKDGGLVVNAGGTVAGSRANGARAITLPSFQQSLAGTTTGTTYQMFGELAWDLAASADTRIEPFARLSYVKADFGALAETGGVAALTAAKQGNDVTITNLGMRFGANVASGKVALNASASWQGTTGDRDARTVIGIAALGQNSNIRSVLIDRSALSLQADAGVNLSDTIRFSLGYSGLIGKRNDDHGGRATLNFAF